MHRLFFWVLTFLSVVAAFLAALIVAPMGDIDITIPGKAVGTAAGVLTFVGTLVILALLSSVVPDLLLYKSCRSMFWMMLCEKYWDWRVLLPASVTSIIAWAFLGPWGALIIGLCILVMIFSGIYIYGRGVVIGTVGPDLYYRN